MNRNKENPPPPKITIRNQTQTPEITEEMPQINKRRKSEKFSAILEFFNAKKIPPTSTPQVGKKHPEKMDQKRPLKKELKDANNFDDTLMPQEQTSQEKSHQKSNTPKSPLFKSIAVGKINQENLNPPPASTSARPELRAKISQKFKNFGGKKPPNRPANHTQERTFNLAKTDVIGSRPGVSNQTKTEL